MILAELAAYPVPEGQLPLLERPQIVALNKIDVPEAKDLAELVRPDLEARGFRVFEISTVSHEGLRQLTFALGDIVAAHRVAEAAKPVARADRHPPARARSSEFTIRVEGGTYGDIYRILGEKPVRWVQQTDFQNEEAVGYLADRLEKLGVEDELFRAGRARPASTVVIGEGDGVVFDWQPSLGSAAELMTAPRGTDPRLDMNPRRTTSQRREQYHESMDAKAEARAELEAERIAAKSSADRPGRRGDGVTALHARATSPPPAASSSRSARRRSAARTPARSSRSSRRSPQRTRSGTEVVLVSSGAIATGMPYLRLDERPSDLATQQAAAAVGQNVLIYRYQDALRPFRIVAGQVLLTAGDLENPTPPLERAPGDGAAARPAHPADRQRERHRRDARDPLRRQRPPRGARRRS